MRRVVVTGLGALTPAGLGATPLMNALAAGMPLGEIEAIPTLRGAAHPVRVARLPPFDREEHIPARTLRRMGDVSQIWTIACQLAREDAGLAGEAAAHPPERRGLFMGTGFGCIDATWEYLRQMAQEGMGTTSPFLFSESVANAPAGHSAIALDTRGPCVTFTCGDASAIVAVARAAEAIRQGRLDIAWAGGGDMMVPILLRVLAAMGVPSAGEGAVCLVLEELDHARARGARILAEVARAGMASDPRVTALQWPRDRARIAEAMTRAARPLPDEPSTPAVARVYLQGAPDALAAHAERDASSRCFPDARLVTVDPVIGFFGASGGHSVAAALMSVAEPGGAHSPANVIVSGPSWGGGITCLRLRSVPH